MRVAHTSGQRRQAGFNLIELMVAMAIGLFMLLAVAQVFLSGVSTSRTEDNAARLQESGRIAIELIGREMRKAGYIDNPVRDRETVFEAENGFAKLVSVGATTQTLTLRYVAGQDTFNQNCLGARVAAGTMIVQTFSVAGGELQCTAQSAGGAAQTQGLVPDVEAISVLAAVDTNADREPDDYVDPTTVADWTTVLGFDIQVRLVSPNDNVTLAPQAYLDFNGALTNPTDRRLRRTYGTFLALRNAILR